MAHQLSLQITDGLDCSTLIIRDASQWDPNIPIQNGFVEVMSPLGDCFYPFAFSAAGFGIIVGCSGLQICCTDCTPSESQLPDGNYDIKVSVDPNLKTIQEYNYFRNCNLYSKYIRTICDLRIEKCNLRPSEYLAKLQELRPVKELIDGAKWMAEECLNVKQALAMYNEAVVLLEQFNHDGCLR